jgi:hypothetical protein
LSVDVFLRSATFKLPRQVAQNSVMGKIMKKIERVKVNNMLTSISEDTFFNKKATRQLPT